MSKAKNSAKEFMKDFNMPVIIEPHGLKSKMDFHGSQVKRGWKTAQKSKTVPNRTLSLRQIADRFAAGLNTIDEKIALYDDGQVIIKNFQQLDLTERYEIVKNAEDIIRKKQHALQLAKKEKHQQEYSAEVQKQVDLRLAEIAKTKIDNP